MLLESLFAFYCLIVVTSFFVCATLSFLYLLISLASLLEDILLTTDEPTRSPPHIIIAMASYEVIGIAVVAALYFLYKALNATDTPKIKGLPEIPGVPIFGNLIQLGTDHARVAQKWVAKYGPVFQTRLGNRVS